MEKITTVKELRDAIARLESRQTEDWQALKEEAHAVSKQLQPASLVKKFVTDLTSSDQLKNGLINAGIGSATGLLAKKLVTAGSNNPLSSIAGNLIESLVAKAVARHPEDIKAIGRFLLKKFIGKDNEEKKD